MLNEGSVSNDTTVRTKSAMLTELEKLREATPDQWERAVFEALTGGSRDDVDWDVEDNQAGYYTWLKAFDQLVVELVEDGHVVETVIDGERYLTLCEPEPGIRYDSATPPNR